MEQGEPMNEDPLGQEQDVEEKVQVELSPEEQLKQIAQDQMEQEWKFRAAMRRTFRRKKIKLK